MKSTAYFFSLLGYAAFCSGLLAFPNAEGMHAYSAVD